MARLVEVLQVQRVIRDLVSAEGGITIVETKLWKNPEKHRTVVAQVIDYAKELATWDYDQLCSAVTQSAMRRGQNETQLDALVLPKLSGGTKLTEFQEAVAECLARGNFLLLIVGDRISPNIALLTKAIQAAPGLEFTLGLVEMQLYELEIGQDWPLVIVPEIRGRTVEKTRGVVRVQYTHVKPNVQVKHPEEIDEDEIEGNLATADDEAGFFRDLGDVVSESQLEVARSVFSWMKDRYHETKCWKGGKKDGAAGNLLAGRKGSPFTLKRNGQLQINFGWMKNKIDGFEEEKRLELRKRFNQIEGIELTPDLHPKIPLSALTDPKMLQQFLEAASWCVNEIKDVYGK